MMMTAEELGKFAKVVEDARRAHDYAKDETEAARSKETAALNWLNSTQKEFDEAIAEFRALASGQSDWHQKTQEVGPS